MSPQQSPSTTAQAQTEAISLPLDFPAVQFPSLDRHQIINLLTQIPGVFNKVAGGDSLPEDAAKALAHLTQQASLAEASALPDIPGAFHGMAEPGPSSHPHGPPNFGQPAPLVIRSIPTASPALHSPKQEDDEGDDDADARKFAKSTGGRRRGGGAAMGSDEWSRQRKDNHKEVERRRRENINEGIEELGRIVPNGSGEKSKGATLSRAVQYIHHLQENEARNIEKWTLEKLLMDQALGDTQAQLEEMRKLWEQEHHAREKAERELTEAQRIKTGKKRPNGVEHDDGVKKQRT